MDFLTPEIRESIFSLGLSDTDEIIRLFQQSATYEVPAAIHGCLPAVLLWATLVDADKRASARLFRS